MKKNRILLVMILMGFVTASHSGFAKSFTPVVALGLASGATEPNGLVLDTGQMVSAAYGFGGLFGFTMFPKSFAEFGLIYLSRGWIETNDADESVQTTLNTIQLPVTFHYQVLPVLAVGLGGYFSHAFGSAHSQLVTDSSQTFDTSFGPGSWKADDYGVVVSVSLNVNITSFLKLIVDGRYLHGIQNVSNHNDTTIFLRDYQVLGGIRIGK